MKQTYSMLIYPNGVQVQWLLWITVSDSTKVGILFSLFQMILSLTFFFCCPVTFHFWFYHCTTLAVFYHVYVFNGDLSKWNTNAVIDMTYSKITQQNLELFFHLFKWYIVINITFTFLWISPLYNNCSVYPNYCVQCWPIQMEYTCGHFHGSQ